MIVFDLSCNAGHRFEGWFASSADFAAQRAEGRLSCPVCASSQVEKAPMAPAVAKKSNQAVVSPAPAERPPHNEHGEGGGGVGNDAGSPDAVPAIPAAARQALEKLAEAQAKALKNSKWVGRKFAEESRAMHYGEQDESPIHGEATPAEAQALREEGVPVTPLPFPVVPPDKRN